MTQLLRHTAARQRDRHAGRRLLLVPGGRVRPAQGRRERRIGLHRRPRRQSDLPAGVRRRHRPCRGGARHLRSQADRLSRSARRVLRDPRSDHLNRQGNDVGTQYRSAIFYHSPEQKRIAEEEIKRLAEDGVYDDRIVTEVTPAGPFYVAEDYHQEYFANNPRQPLLHGGGGAEGRQVPQEVPGEAEEVTHRSTSPCLRGAGRPRCWSNLNRCSSAGKRELARVTRPRCRATPACRSCSQRRPRKPPAESSQQCA